VENSADKVVTLTKPGKRRKKDLSSQLNLLPIKFLLKNKILFDYKELYHKNKVKVIDQATWNIIDQAGKVKVIQYCTKHRLPHYLIYRTVDISVPEAGLRSKSTTIHSSKITNFVAWKEIKDLI